MKRFYQFSPIWIGFTIAIAHILLFYPGMLSFDADTCQIPEAQNWIISDEHPPLMAVLIGLWFKIGFGIPGIFMVQDILFWLGTTLLVNQILLFLLPEEEFWKSRFWICISTVLCLALPLSPYTFSAAIIGKDIWMLIAILWGIQFFLSTVTQESKTRKMNAILMGLCFAIAASLRHNSIVLIPIACISLTVVLWRQFKWRTALTIASLPVITFLIIHTILQFFITIKGRHTERFVYAADMILFESMYGENPEMHIVYLDSFLKENYRMHVKFGHVIPLLDQIADKSLVLDASNFKEIKKNYTDLWKRYPLQLARIKIYSFISILGIDWSFDVISGYYGRKFHDNKTNIEDSYLKSASPLIHLFNQIGFRRIYRPIILGHYLWLSLSIATIALIGSIWLKNRCTNRTLEVWIVLLSFPIVYSLSFLIACPQASYRYVMPSNLIIQIYFILFVVAYIIRTFTKARYQR